MNTIINCESQWNTEIQSKHTYHAGNVPDGFQVGDREQSFGLVQIHLPAHPTVSYEEAIDPEYAIEFLARNLANGKGHWWTCYNTHVALI